MSSNGSSPAPRREARVTRQARLDGASTTLDRRVNAVRPDLADIALAARVAVPRYAVAVPMHCRAAVAILYAGPDATSVCVSELLFGEGFGVFDRVAGWAWGQCEGDGYVGWVRWDMLVARTAAPTDVVTAPQALLFEAPTIKAPVAMTLPLGARVAAVPHDGSFLAVGDLFLHRRHVAPLAGDTVDLAYSFIGAPYRWGGRTRAGVDCSGLVQAVLGAHGVACPRDSDQQFAAFPAVSAHTRQRGDLVAFPGHIGILVDTDRLLHANAFHMTTLVEPLADVVARLQPLHVAPVLGTVRPPCRGSGASL